MNRKHTVLRNLIAWTVRKRGREWRSRIIYHGDESLSHFRHPLFWHEEWPRSWWQASVDLIDKTYKPIDSSKWTGRPQQPYFRPPFWRPFNMFFNCWWRDAKEEYHDHTRWTFTLVLQGALIEHTPWGVRYLGPGAMVFRSHKYIHAVQVYPPYRGKTWTLFIVGPRNHKQNTYSVRPQP